MSEEQNGYRQNDPDRAGGLISDAQGEFVLQSPGGPFDPRAFRSGPRDAPAADPDGDHGTGEPPMTGGRMSSPREEIDKAK